MQSSVERIRRGRLYKYLGVVVGCGVISLVLLSFGTWFLSVALYFEDDSAESFKSLGASCVIKEVQHTTKTLQGQRWASSALVCWDVYSYLFAKADDLFTKADYTAIVYKSREEGLERSWRRAEDDQISPCSCVRKNAQCGWPDLSQAATFKTGQVVECWEPHVDELHRMYRCGRGNKECVKIFDPQLDVESAQAVAKRVRVVSVLLFLFATAACSLVGYGAYRAGHVWRTLTPRDAESYQEVVVLPLGRVSAEVA